MSVLQRIERRIENMRTMLTRFGIDVATLTQVGSGGVFASAMRACQACPNEAICTAWLAQAGAEIARIPEFCPNALRWSQVKPLMDLRGTMH